MWSLAGILALLAVLLLAAHWLASGGLGARYVGQRLDGVSIPGAGELQVSGFGGDLLDTVRAGTIQLVDEDGAWLTLNSVTLDWRPRALADRIVQIQELRAEEAILHRLPRVQNGDSPSSGGSGGSLPDASLVLDELFIDQLTIEEDAFGVRAEYAVTGAAALRREGGGAVNLNAVEAAGGADALALEARLEPDGQLALEAEAGSSAGGLVATLLGAPEGQEARLRLAADGATMAGDGEFALRFGGEPAAEGTVGWTREEITAAARVEAARWGALRDVSEMAGPVADLEASLTGYRGETPTFALTLDTERLDIALNGTPPTGENLREQGLEVELSLTDLGVWTAGTVLADTVSFAGSLVRNDNGFVADGTLGAENFGAFSIRAEQLSGPAILNFADGALSFDATLDGAGGGGAAEMVARLVGDQPDVVLQGDFFIEERLLAIETLRLDSEGRAVETSVEIALRPDGEPKLAMEGTAQNIPLGAMLPNITGDFTGEFSVGRQTQSDPLTIQAKGEAVNVSGAPEIVAAPLGSSPDIDFEATVVDGVLRIQRAVVEGPGLRAGAQGTLANGELALDVEAAMQGPTPLPGGLELGGELLARGTVAGPAAAPTLEAQIFADRLNAAGAAFDMPVADVTVTFQDGVSGTAELTAQSGFGPASANISFGRGETGFEAPDLNLDWADIAVSGGIETGGDGVMRGALTLTKTGDAPGPWPGTLDGRIELLSIGGEQGARISVTTADIAFPERQVWIDSAELNAAGPLQALEFQIDAEGVVRSLPVTAAADGVFGAADGARRVSMDLTAQAGNVEIASEEPIVLTLGEGGTRSLRARVGVETGRIAIDYEDGQDGALIALDISEAPVSIIEAARREPRLAGTLDAALNLDTRGGGMSGDVSATLTNARAVDAEQEQIDMDLRGTIAGGTLTGSLNMRGEGGLAARAEGSLPLERGEGALPVRVAMDAPLSGQLSADGPVGTISVLLLGAEQRLEGEVFLDTSLSGTPNNPRFSGQGGITDGRFDDAVSGLILDDLDIALGFSNNRVEVINLSANDGRGGQLTGSGAARSSDGDWTGEVNAAVQDFRVVNRADAQARLSGQLSASMTPDRRVIEGDLTVVEGEFAPPAAAPPGVRTLEVTEINLPGEREDERVTGRTSPPIELDISITADRRLFIRSSNIDAELSVNVNIGGTARDPSVRGEANVVRGDVDLAGRRFVLDTGRVQFSGDPLQSQLDFQATRDTADLTAIIRVQGTPRAPRITLESRPELPQDEILAQVLFGRSATDLSALEAAQLASALASMSGGGGFDALGNLRAGLGLDRLAVGQNREGEAQISGGRYLTDDVYLELTTGAEGTAAAQVEWQALDNFAIISRFGNSDTTSVSVRWRTTY